MSNLVTRLLVPLLLITVSEAIGCVLDHSPTSDLDAVRVVRYSATKGSYSDKAWITIGDHSYRESVLLGSGAREWWIENTDKPVKVCYSTGEYQISSNSQPGQLYHLESPNGDVWLRRQVPVLLGWKTFWIWKPSHLQAQLNLHVWDLEQAKGLPEIKIIWKLYRETALNQQSIQQDRGKLAGGDSGSLWEIRQQWKHNVSRPGSYRIEIWAHSDIEMVNLISARNGYQLVRNQQLIVAQFPDTRKPKPNRPARHLARRSIAKRPSSEMLQELILPFLVGRISHRGD